ncbi:MAG: hypothetical protein OEW04_03755 [Nitrospirota bacterium]|nr:hypothetical protein [Nitrospirota bacterium]
MGYKISCPDIGHWLGDVRFYTQGKTIIKRLIGPEEGEDMEDGLITGGILMLLLVMIAVNFLQIIKGIRDWYRITNYLAFRTSLTVAELQRMRESRRLQAHNR